MKPLDSVEVRREAQRIVEAQEVRRRDALRRESARRVRSWARASRGKLTHFTVGDFVLVARVLKMWQQAKLVSRWTEPSRVVSDDRERVYKV